MKIQSLKNVFSTLQAKSTGNVLPKEALFKNKISLRIQYMTKDIRDHLNEQIQ